MKHLLMMLVSVLTYLGLVKNPAASGPIKSFYDFKLKTIDGHDFDFQQLKGKKVLIVNTASQCGFTPQYEDLEKLNRMFGSEKFVILGFPANDFMGQEPGTNADIASFCKQKYDVHFQMFEKISVKGDDTNPLYLWLTNKSQNGISDATVKWNFNKFLIDENGSWVSWLGSKTKPLDDEIINWIRTGKVPQ